MLARPDAAHFSRNRAQGSLARVTEESYIAQLSAYLADTDWPADWYERNRDLLEPLRPVYEGDAEPITLNRAPGPQFQ